MRRVICQLGKRPEEECWAGKSRLPTWKLGPEGTQFSIVLAPLPAWPQLPPGSGKENLGQTWRERAGLYAMVEKLAKRRSNTVVGAASMVGL